MPVRKQGGKIFILCTTTAAFGPAGDLFREYQDLLGESGGGAEQMLHVLRHDRGGGLLA